MSSIVARIDQQQTINIPKSRFISNESDHSRHVGGIGIKWSIVDQVQRQLEYMEINK